MQLQVGQKENVFDGQSHSNVKVHLFHSRSGQTGLMQKLESFYSQLEKWANMEAT